MKKILFKALRFVLFLSIGIILLYLAFKSVDLEKLLNSFRSARYGWILVSLVFGFVSMFSRARRWVLLIEPLNYRPGFMNTYHSLMTGYLANYAFPRLGEITRCASLAKADKIPADKLIGTVIVERAVDVLMLAILLFTLILGRFDFFGVFIKENIFQPLYQKMNGSLAGSLIVWILLAGIPGTLLLYLLFRKRLSGIGIVVRIKSIIKGIIDGLKTIYQMKRRWEFIFHSFFIWGCYWAMTYFAMLAVPATAELQWIDGLFVLVVGSLGFVAPVQGGIGAFHWVVTLGLTLYAIPREEALTYATLTHGSQMIMLILLGLISMMVLFSVGRSRNQVVQPEPETLP